MNARMNEDAWEKSYERLAAKLVLFARQWLSLADAEDCVHDAFVRIWKRRDAGAFNDAYFFAATRSAVFDRLRSRRRREDRELENHLLFEPVETPADLSGQDVAAALSGLPAEQREVVVLRVWGGLGFAEIAKVTRTSLGTASSRYRYGIEQMKKFFTATAP